MKTHGRGSWRTWVPVAGAVVCFALAAVSIFTKYRSGYRLVGMDRETVWRVSTVLDVEVDRTPASVRCMMPLRATARQEISDLEFVDDGCRRGEEGLYVVWSHPGTTPGRKRFVMKFRARTQAKEYVLPAAIEWEDLETAGQEQYLASDSLIQASDGDLRAQAELLRRASDDVTAFVRALLDYVRKKIAYRSSDGDPTDALTAYRLGEASCNGKSRLFVAMARSQGIPGRLAKGLILEQGVQKTTSHVWAELYLDGQWIPFCPTAGYFARIPERYLEYPKVDERMFAYTKDLAFQSTFRIRKGAQTIEEAFRADLDHPHHLLRAWGSLNRAEFSLDLLLVLLTIPVGATLVAFVRNIVGLTPLGTFLPALIAVSCRSTGLGWGMAMFCLIVAVGVIVNEGLRCLHLLHFPRLTVVLTFVVATIIGLSLLAMHFGNVRAANVGMFPLAIMTLTVERITILRERYALRTALGRLAVSLGTAAVCYAGMTSFAVRSTLLVFPEVLLVCVGLNLLMGVYTGLRWMEYVRFRPLTAKDEP